MTPEEKRAYNQKYWAANKERLSAYNKARREEDPEDNRVRCRAWRAKNAQRHRDNQKRYREENREYVLQKKREWYMNNKERHRRRDEDWKKRNPEKVWESTLRAAYGLNLSDWQAMFEAQGGVCAICRRTCKANRRLSVDHCHDSGKVRGLLCQLCNSAIGKLYDSPALVQRALEYLIKHHGADYPGRSGTPIA